MFKFFLSRYNIILKEKQFVFPIVNTADIIPVLSSYLTNCCPRIGKHLTHGLIKLFFGNKIFLRWSYARQHNTILQSTKPGPILVIADLNIGDAINIQVACQTLKQLFPEREVHYAINKKAYSFITHNPDIDKTLPVFSGTAIPTNEDVEKVKTLTKKAVYSLIFNFCPFFETNTFNGCRRHVLNHYPLSIGIAYDELKTQNLNHLRKKIFSYLTQLFPEESTKNNVRLKDVPVFIDDHSLKLANYFLKKIGFYGKNGIVLFNPDATSPYTKLPLSKQIELVQKLLDSGVEYLLISSGFIFKGVEKDILSQLNIPNSKKCIIVPKSFCLDTYAAIIDQCDAYITNDTGPLHLAASRKKDKQGNFLRNKTAIFSIFGATPARIYAYDSENPMLFPAPQDAPSRTFVSRSSCRNITCINKLSKRCKTVRCFEGLEPREIANEIVKYLKDKTWN
jgi:ADP-heptose:LPS heptosyltransferase